MTAPRADADAAADTDADPLAALLAGRLADPDGGPPLSTSIRAIVIGDDLADDAGARLDALGLGRRMAVLADVDTAAALGDRVARALAGRGRVQAVTLGRRPHPDDDTAARLDATVDVNTDVVVSVGSGTLTDLGKLLAFRRGLPHVAFATAPSMNGYASVAASITSAGLKRSLRVAAPTMVLLDTAVLAAAPARLIRAGLGDSLCRPTAQTDWLLAHRLLDRPYRPAPFALLAADEAALFAEPAALLAGDRAAMRHLARTLVLSGCGMTICGGSYPASQGEHLLSHHVEAVAPVAHDQAPLHGEQIAVTTLTMARLQHAILAADQPPRLHASTIAPADLIAHFGPDRGPACWRELVPKLIDHAGAEARTARLAAIWDDLRAAIAAIAIDPARLRAILVAAGAPTAPADLGWSPRLVDDGVRFARALRDRYTFLDLAADGQQPPHG